MLITPTAITPFGKGVVGEVVYTTIKGGQEQIGKAKAYMSDHGLVVGQEKEVTFEQRDNEYPAGTITKETWIKSPPKGGGGFKGGGGGGKADPEKLAIEREKLVLDAQKNEDIKRICDDKAVDIISQVVFKAAVESIIHETKQGSQINPDAVDVLAAQYVQIFHKIRAGVSA